MDINEFQNILPVDGFEIRADQGRHHDLDALTGSWDNDPECEKARGYGSEFQLGTDACRFFCSLV